MLDGHPAKKKKKKKDTNREHKLYIRLFLLPTRCIIYKFIIFAFFYFCLLFIFFSFVFVV